MLSSENFLQPIITDVLISSDKGDRTNSEKCVDFYIRRNKIEFNKCLRVCSELNNIYVVFNNQIPMVTVRSIRMIFFFFLFLAMMTYSQTYQTTTCCQHCRYSFNALLSNLLYFIFTKCNAKRPQPTSFQHIAIPEWCTPLLCALGAVPRHTQFTPIGTKNSFIVYLLRWYLSQK